MELSLASEQLCRVQELREECRKAEWRGRGKEKECRKAEWRGRGKEKGREGTSIATRLLALQPNCMQLKPYLLPSREWPPSSIFLQKKGNTDLIQKVRYFIYQHIEPVSQHYTLIYWSCILNQFPTLHLTADGLRSTV